MTVSANIFPYFIELIGVRIFREMHPQMNHNDTKNITITILPSEPVIAVWLQLATSWKPPNKASLR